MYDVCRQFSVKFLTIVERSDERISTVGAILESPLRLLTIAFPKLMRYSCFSSLSIPTERELLLPTPSIPFLFSLFPKTKEFCTSRFLGIAILNTKL